MPTILWWVIGAVAVLILLYVLRLAYRALELRWLSPIVFGYLSVPDVTTALTYIEWHPKLLDEKVSDYIGMLLQSVWADGDIELFLSGTFHLELLAQCRQHGVESVRQMMDDLRLSQPVLKRPPGWQRAAKVMGQLATEGKVDIPPEELDEELVEAMDQITSMLGALADEDAAAALAEINQGLHQALEQKNRAASQPSAETPIKAPASAQRRKRKKKRRRK